MSIVLPCLFFVATVIGVGYGLSRIVFRREQVTRLESVTFSLGIGLGITPLLMFSLALTGVRLTPTSLVALFSPFCLFSAITFWRDRRHWFPIQKGPSSPWSSIEKLLTGIILSAVVMSLILAVTTPFVVWDAVTTWGFKAKVLYTEQTIFTDAFLDHDGSIAQIRPRPMYPFGLPLIESLFATWMGTFDELGLKLTAAIFFGLLLLALYSAARHWYPRRYALLGCALFVSIPFSYYQSWFRILLVGGKKSAILGGMADLPLACFLFLSVDSLYRWMVRSEPGYLISAAIFAGAAAFMKNEGLAFSVIIMVTLGFFIVAHRRNRRWSDLARFTAIWLVVIGPWLVFRPSLPMEPVAERFQWSWAEIARTIYSIPRVTGFIAVEMIDISSWGFVWLILIGVTLWKGREVLASPVKYLYMILIAGIAVYILVISLAPVAHIWRAFFASRALARLLYQLTPLAVFLVLNTIARPQVEPHIQDIDPLSLDPQTQ